MNWVKVECTLYMDQKVWLSLVKKDQLCAIALMNRKWILKVLLKIVAMATSHSLLRHCFIALTPTPPALLQLKQDLTVKQTYRASSCFVLWYEPKFWQLTLVSTAFYSPFLEITSFHTTPIGQIIPCHVTEVKLLRFLGYMTTTLLIFN